MSWVMILIVSHAVTKIDFDSKAACEQAKDAVKVESAKFGDSFIIVCTPKNVL